MNWADEHGIGYLPWAWWNADGTKDDTTGDAGLYALYQGTNFAPHAPAGTNYKAHLAALAVPGVPVIRTLPAPITNPLLATGSAAASSPARSSPADIPAPALHQLQLDTAIEPRVSTP
jgi:hypothetical protein